jgi:F-type H+-transporting ATPase subunit b
MATNSHTEQPTGHKGAFPPFNPQTFGSQLFWLVIAFVVLYAILAKIAIPRVGGIIENRQKRIADDIAAAGMLKQQSDEAIAAYEKALADARARAQLIANETRDKQQAEAETRRKRLEDELNVKLADAEKTIAATKQAAMANVRGIAADATKAIVERLIGESPSDKDADAAVADALKG